MWFSVYNQEILVFNKEMSSWHGALTHTSEA